MVIRQQLLPSPLLCLRGSIPDSLKLQKETISLNVGSKNYNDEVGWRWFVFCSIVEVSDIRGCHFREVEMYWWENSSFCKVMGETTESSRNEVQISMMRIIDWTEGLFCSCTVPLFITLVLCWLDECCMSFTLLLVICTGF